jgi:1-acyl-sn-glycerol-3-phosphate acyltransferase
MPDDPKQQQQYAPTHRPDTLTSMADRLRYPRDQQVPMLGRLLWRAGPPVLRVVGRAVFSLSWRCPEQMPSPPFVVAANHLSHLDPPVIGAVMGTPIRYLALDELAEANRFLAAALPTFGAIPVPRVGLPIATLRVALSRLAEGESVGVFPEGYRVEQWGDRPIKRGAAWLAVKSGVPLIPVAVRGTDRALGLDNRLRRSPIEVVIGTPMSPVGENPTSLTERWADWIGEQVALPPER